MKSSTQNSHVLPRRLLLLLLLASLVFHVATPAPAYAADTNWPQWRGPSSLGVSTEKNLPDEWSGGGKNIKWKTALPGRGHSSPIIWGKRIFLTTAIEGEIVPGAKAPKHIIEGQEFKHPDALGSEHRHTLKVISLDRETGKILWERTAYDGTVYDDRHKKASYASATPVTDGRNVYAFFGSEGVYAYDFKGQLLWKSSVGKLGTLGVGQGISPVLYENLLILQCDHEDGADSFIVALDKQTGKEVWRVPRKVQLTWATPIIVRTAKRAELVASGVELLASYDPATGKEFWRHKGLDSNAVPSPVAAHDMVYVASGYPTKIIYALRLGGSGDITNSPQVAWTYKKGTAYVPSPIVYGDYIYLLTDRGIITCLDARTGEVKYEGSRVPVPATFTASPVAFDGKLLITSEDGDTFVLKAGPTFEVLRTNSVGEPVYASPAIADGKIFLRGQKHLYCIARQTK